MPENKLEHLKWPKFDPDTTRPHVYLDREKLCRTCRTKVCLTICPAQVFQLAGSDDDAIEILYRQCVECGACRLVCPQNNIVYRHPSGGHGVIFHEG